MMALARALARAASRLNLLAKAPELHTAPQRSLAYIAYQNINVLTTNLLGKGAAEHSPATSSIDQRIVYVPPSAREPVVLPTLRTPWDYTLPSLVKPVIGIKEIVVPSTDANSNGLEKTDPSPAGGVSEKRAVNMLIIRRKKMKKHKLRKLRKKMYFLWAKRRFRREKAKEQAFRAELLSQIHEAQAFDAEKFVKGVFDSIRNRPRPETREERRERMLDLMRKHRSNVQYIKPKFD